MLLAIAGTSGMLNGVPTAIAVGARFGWLVVPVAVVVVAVGLLFLIEWWRWALAPLNRL